MEQYRAKPFELAWDTAKRTVHLSFEAFSNKKPDPDASFEIAGPYCDLRRSEKERIFFRLKNPQMLKILLRAKAVYIAEKDSNGSILWIYKAKTQMCRDR